MDLFTFSWNIIYFHIFYFRNGIACKNCYMESTPKNDALVYLSAEEVRRYLECVQAFEAGSIDACFKAFYHRFGKLVSRHEMQPH